MKILLLDIETKPAVVYVWGLWNQNIAINQIVDGGQTICWSAKWLGEDEVFYYGHNTVSHKTMIKKLHQLLSKADAVIHYNGQKFDIPTVNGEFVKLGLVPPAPYKQIDILKTVKARFRFPSFKLDYVAQQLKLGKKLEHKGFDLWTGCMNGVKEDWDVMQAYNIQDVLLLEQLYYRLQPWIKNHPRVGEGVACPTCGGHHLQKRGTINVGVSLYQQYQCQDCGRWFRDGTNLADKKQIKMRELAL